MDDKEIWAVVIGLPRYEISDRGGLRRAVDGLRLRPCAASGYCLYNFTIEPGQRRRTASIHRLMWEAHVGPIPPGMQINHINGIKTDNRICNLEVVTPGENIRHAHKLGLSPSGDRHWSRTRPENIPRGADHNWVRLPWTRPRGERHGLAKLTDEIVREIRQRACCGETGAALAREFGVSKVTACKVINREIWTHVLP